MLVRRRPAGPAVFAAGFTLLALAAIVVALVSASPVHLGVHWTSDALAGLLLGVLLLAVVGRLLDRAHERRPDACVHG